MLTSNIPSRHLAKKTLEIAAGYLGQKEKTGHNDGTFVEGIQHWFTGGNDSLRGQPWCAMFATWCIWKAALALSMKYRLPKSTSSTSIFLWYQRNELLLSAPIENCIGLVRGDGGTPGKTHHHTFMVESVDLAAGLVHSVDGNSENQVERTKHRIQDCDFGPIL